MCKNEKQFYSLSLRGKWGGWFVSRYIVDFFGEFLASWKSVSRCIWYGSSSSLERWNPGAWSFGMREDGWFWGLYEFCLHDMAFKKGFVCPNNLNGIKAPLLLSQCEMRIIVVRSARTRNPQRRRGLGSRGSVRAC